MGWAVGEGMVFTSLLTNLVPEALTGVLCFTSNLRSDMLVLHLHVLGEEVSRASNEAAVVLVVTQPAPDPGGDLVLQHLGTPTHM